MSCLCPDDNMLPTGPVNLTHTHTTLLALPPRPSVTTVSEIHCLMITVAPIWSNYPTPNASCCTCSCDCVLCAPVDCNALQMHTIVDTPKLCLHCSTSHVRHACSLISLLHTLGIPHQQPPRFSPTWACKPLQDLPDE